MEFEFSTIKKNDWNLNNKIWKHKNGKNGIWIELIFNVLGSFSVENRTNQTEMAVYPVWR